MSKRNQHVVPHPMGWAVKPARGQRASSIHTTQQQARERAREIARNQRTEMLVHGRNGRIRERNSYGRDPHPPTG